MSNTSEIESKQYSIEGMCCPNCAVTIKNAISKVDGVEDVNINFMNETMTVISPSSVGVNIIEKVKSTGYSASVLERNQKSDVQEEVPDKIPLFNVNMVLIVVSAVLIAAAIIVRISGLNNYLHTTLIFLAIALAGKPIAHKGIIAVRNLNLDMDFLMFIAVMGAILIGEWEEAGMIVVLIAIADWLEAASISRSRKAIESLIKLTPQTATLLRNGEEVILPVEQINKSDVLLVRPGDMIPLDGSVRKGSSSVDQSSITGESIPIPKTIDDIVLAGSINFDGSLEITVTKSPGDTTLDRIVKLVKLAQDQCAPVQSSIDRFAAVYTPIVVGVAVLVATIPPLITELGWSVWIYRSLVLLMIACPCAFVISTPVTFVSGLAAAARRGVLVKGGAILENLSRINAMAFDKTGTITEGNLVVTNIQSTNGYADEEILRLAASVESLSEHPVAQAIVDHARSTGLTLDTPNNFRAYPGRGAVAEVDGKLMYVGNRKWFSTLDFAGKSTLGQLSNIEIGDHASVLVGDENQIYGILNLKDEIRMSALETVKQLLLDGVQKIFMLTGDNLQVGNAIGKSAGIERVMSNLLPEDKVSAINDIRSNFETVAMVGDGVNDAPALATSDVGIAMGGRGTDAALETADIVLMGDRLERLPWLFRLSQKTHRIIVANIFLAIAIKFLFVMLAITGYATLWMAIFADTGVTLLVIFNGMRVLSTK